MSDLVGVSAYGRVNAGIRARFITFCERVGVDYELATYFSGNSAGLGAFAQHPGSITSELSLRRLAKARVDRVFIRKEASPLSSGELERSLLRSAGYGVFDLDDAMFQDVRSRAFEALFSKGRKATVAAAAADVVIAGNVYLAEWADPLSRDVRIIPTCVEPGAYVTKTDFEVGGRPQLVWLGTRTGEGYLSALAPVLLRLHEKLGAQLTIIGSTRPGLGELERMIVRRPWSSESVHTDLAEYDIGLMPLLDTPFARGKCAYKLLEYGAASLPAIASPVGMNREVLSRANQAAPESPDEWYDAIATLITSPTTDRTRYARRLHNLVSDEFSFARWAPNWRTAVLG